MANIVQVTCSKCEGTGEQVDHFNPPLHGYFDKPNNLALFGIHTTFSGHRILGGTCTACRGTGYDYIIGVQEQPQRA